MNLSRPSIVCISDSRYSKLGKDHDMLWWYSVLGTENKVHYAHKQISENRCGIYPKVRKLLLSRLDLSVTYS